MLIKLGTVGVWGQADTVVAMIAAAQRRGVDVTADAYPYLAWQAGPRVGERPRCGRGAP